MNAEEFKRTVRRIETEDQLTFDLRPFDARQSEAIDSYLSGVMTAVEVGVFGCTKPITLVCTGETAFSAATNVRLKNVEQRGVMVEIRRVAATA